MSRKPNIAINGLGRIGRLVTRILIDSDKANIVAINDLAENATLAHLLKYDTAHRKWNRAISSDEKNLFVDGIKIPCFAISEPEKLPWKELEVDIVLECTGFFRSRDKVNKHIEAGAKKVVISAPAKGDIKTIVLGVNDQLLSKEDTIVSNASCTTNCLAPMAMILHEIGEIQHGFMNTVHAYTADQKLQDSIHKSDLRRARAAAQNIVPTTTNATSTLGIVMPELKGKITGGASRVPVVTGSLTELYCTVNKPLDKETINQAFKKAAETNLKNILAYTEDAIVSSDIISDPHSCIFDAELTEVIGNMVKIVGWYDNEAGYANRLAELAIKISNL
jgi:glyceraldehyde 3-phosphate dehydrogenase